MTTTADEVACAAHNAKPQPQEWFVLWDSTLGKPQGVAYDGFDYAERDQQILNYQVGHDRFQIRRATVTLGEVIS